jgi:hypothetical protein
MGTLARSTCLVVVGWLVACGSSASPSQDEVANASFAGQGNVATDQACQQDSDCDKHDPCTTFSCRKDSGELAVGRCAYALGDGKGCGGPPGPVGIVTPDPPDASGVADADAVDAADAAAADAGPSACTKALSVRITKISQSTCLFNSTVEESSPATLSYACAGGAASVTFGAQTFTGTETAGSVSLTNVSTYTFTNVKYNVSCKYIATQTISGTVASGKLTWAYTEVLDKNQTPLCQFVTGACTGSGDVTVK